MHIYKPFFGEKKKFTNDNMPDPKIKEKKNISNEIPKVMDVPDFYKEERQSWPRLIKKGKKKSNNPWPFTKEKN